MATFVVHEHHAQHLHFDLRLEMDGVLKSWAVPKGPSMDPADKRLAILVEDHDLSYAAFEGDIAPGSYGAGAVYVWDTGAYSISAGSLTEGKMSLVFDGAVLKGAFSFFQLKGQKGQWLLVKKHDHDAVPGFRLTLRSSKGGGA